MPKPQYSEKELSQLIDQVKKEFTACLNKAEAEEATLAKSEDGEEHEHKEEKPEHEEKEGHEEPKKEMHGEHEGHEAHEEHEGHDYDQEDLEHMEKMYRSMSKGELSAHHDCIQKCMGGSSMAKAESKHASGGEMEECEPKDTPGAKSPASKDQKNLSDMEKGEIEACPPKETPGAKSPASKDQKNLSDMEKGEIEACPPKETPGAKSPASKDQKNLSNMEKGEKGMEKSEQSTTDLLKSQLDNKTAEFDELKKNYEAVQEFLSKLVKKTAPQGKAITSLDVIAKSETSIEDKTLTKKEITEILNKKASDPLLKSEDRKAINDYCLGGQVNINKISHLLK